MLNVLCKPPYKQRLIVLLARTHAYAPPVLQKRGELERATADAVLRALQAPGGAGGDVLAFLPGVAEIKRVQQLLQQEAALRRGGVAVQQLHGSLSPQQQDDVIRWAAGQRAARQRAALGHAACISGSSCCCRVRSCCRGRKLLHSQAQPGAAAAVAAARRAVHAHCGELHYS